MTIRLLALDLDGTLLSSRGELSERNRRAISMARERGVRVAVVTGRRFRDARPIALELGLDAPVISHNGALTKHARSLETISVRSAAARSRAQGSGDRPRAQAGRDGLATTTKARAFWFTITSTRTTCRSSVTSRGRDAFTATKPKRPCAVLTRLTDYLGTSPCISLFPATCATMERLRRNAQVRVE